jgi:tetratricopeptide (TPR) repeat protein
LAIARNIEHRKNICALLGDLGELSGKRADFVQATRYFEEGLFLAREIKSQWYISDTLIKQGNCNLWQSNPEEACAALESAFEIANHIGDKGLVARALFGLAKAGAAQGNLKSAFRHGEQSLLLLSEMGDGLMQEVKIWLGTLKYK